jgi:inosine-uridine nucleoside N-ribohydrolase
VGELTNIAALLESEPGIAKKIKRLVLMGGAIARGYGENTPPVPEWNIKSNIPAARAVFGCGVPITLAPLDATIALKLEPAMRAQIFSHGTPLTDALAALTSTWQTTNSWKGETPTLFDAMAVAMIFAPKLAPTQPRRIEVDATGITRVVAEGQSNVDVALGCDAAESLSLFVLRITGK